MTNRIDHTDCSHDATSASRKGCRDRRRTALRAAQAGYMDYQAYAIDHDAYCELVCTYALICNIEVREAYTIIEEGPVA